MVELGFCVCFHVEVFEFVSLVIRFGAMERLEAQCNPLMEPCMGPGLVS